MMYPKYFPMYFHFQPPALKWKVKAIYSTNQNLLVVVIFSLLMEEQLLTSITMKFASDFYPKCMTACIESCETGDMCSSIKTSSTSMF